MQLLIPHPFGPDTTVMLSIATEDWRSKEVKLAIGERVYDYEPAKKKTTKFYPPKPETEDDTA